MSSPKGAWSTRICRWADNATGAVTITFDGGYAASVRNALPVLERLDLPSTWFLVAGAVGGLLEGRPVAGWGWWRELAATGAVEIGNHSAAHLQLVRVPRTRVDAAKTYAWLRSRRSRGPVPEEVAGILAVLHDAKWGHKIIEWQMGSPVTSYAYPHGRGSRFVGKALERLGVTSARTTTARLNPPSLRNSFSLGSFVWTADTTEEEMSRRLCEALDGGGWLCEVFHLVESPGEYYWTVSPQQFFAHARTLAESGAWVARQEDVVRYALARDRTSVNVRMATRSRAVLDFEGSRNCDLTVVTDVGALAATSIAVEARPGRCSHHRVKDGTAEWTLPADAKEVRLSLCS